MIWLFAISVIMLIAAVLVYTSNKRLAANLYEKTYIREHKVSIPSPYSINRSFNRWEEPRYNVTKNGKSVSPLYYSLEAARSSMNELESIDGIPKTVFGE